MSIRLAYLVLASSLVLGCGDTDEILPDANPIVVDATVPVADAALIDGTPTDAAVNDAALNDATVTDATVTDAAVPDATVTPDATSCGNPCPAENATTTADVANTKGIIIESINVAGSRVTFKNVTAGAKTITNWWLCFGPGFYRQITNTAVIPDGGSLTLVVDTTPCTGLMANEVCVPSSLTVPTTDELALFETATFSPPAAAALHIRAYVRWGASDATTGSARQEAANLAGLWPASSGANDFVEICATDEGLIGTGDVTSALGFTSADSSCF